MNLKLILLILTALTLLTAEALTAYSENLWLDYHDPLLTYPERYNKREKFIKQFSTLSSIIRILYFIFLFLVIVTLTVFIIK